jgi:NAD(P)-dependent dehydrogenase (short-subunit alcohol dehydrogenase family)
VGPAGAKGYFVVAMPPSTGITASSKAAIHQLTRHLARQLGPRNITVNAVAPGPFESKMMAETLRNFGDAIARTSPLGRIGRPDDMAGVAIYLASRAGAYVTVTRTSRASGPGSRRSSRC